MKKLLFIVLMSFLFCSVVTASSINGDYKGNPIVKMMANGKQLDADEVPAMIYDGHTVVPISSLRQLGASVTWDADSYSVDVKLPQSNTTTAVSPSTDIETLKSYSKIADHYNRLYLLGD